MISIEYWCRYHGRIEHSEDEEACLTTEEVQWINEQKRQLRSDPPRWFVRLLGWFGIEVRP